MKKVLIAAAFALSVMACNNSGNGVEGGDTASATLGDTLNSMPNSGIDTNAVNTGDSTGINRDTSRSDRTRVNRSTDTSSRRRSDTLR